MGWCVPQGSAPTRIAPPAPLPTLRVVVSARGSSPNKMEEDKKQRLFKSKGFYCPFHSRWLPGRGPGPSRVMPSGHWGCLAPVWFLSPALLGAQHWVCSGIWGPQEVNVTV